MVSCASSVSLDLRPVTGHRFRQLGMLQFGPKWRHRTRCALGVLSHPILLLPPWIGACRVLSPCKAFPTTELLDLELRGGLPLARWPPAVRGQLETRLGKWLRCDALHRKHPKFRAAGFWAGEVVRATWEIAKAFDLAHGVITQYWIPEYLYDWIDEQADYPAAMAAAERVGLIDRDGDEVLIHDWDEHQPPTSTDRVKKHRSKKVKRDETDETVSRATRNVETPNGTGRDGTRQDGTRRDEKPRDPPPTTTIQDEAQELERRRQGTTRSTEPQPPPFPEHGVLCPKCGDQLNLRGPQPHGWWYTHPKWHHCNFACDAGDYDKACKEIRKAERKEQGQQEDPTQLRPMPKTCPVCRERPVKPGDGLCAECLEAARR